MDILLKQRLVGAIVLISLAVIFIPMLLSGNSELMSSRIKSNIPPEPSYEIRRLEIQPLANSDSTSSELLIEKKPQPPVVETINMEKAVNAVGAKIAVIEPALPEPPTPQTPPAPEVTAPTAQALKTPNLEKESTKSDSTNDIAVVTSWIVQVGSFAREANALSLRDKLRKKGFASFVTEAKSQSGNVYRVRVGPELNRELADNLRKKIHKQYQLDGIVMRYP